MVIEFWVWVVVFLTVWLLLFLSDLGVENFLFYVSVVLNSVQKVLFFKRIPTESFGRNAEPTWFILQYLQATAGIIATSDTEHM